MLQIDALHSFVSFSSYFKRVRCLCHICHQSSFFKLLGSEGFILVAFTKLMKNRKSWVTISVSQTTRTDQHFGDGKMSEA